MSNTSRFSVSVIASFRNFSTRLSKWSNAFINLKHLTKHKLKHTHTTHFNVFHNGFRHIWAVERVFLTVIQHNDNPHTVHSLRIQNLHIYFVFTPHIHAYGNELFDILSKFLKLKRKKIVKNSHL